MTNATIAITAKIQRRLSDSLCQKRLNPNTRLSAFIRTPARFGSLPRPRRTKQAWIVRIAHDPEPEVLPFASAACSEAGAKPAANSIAAVRYTTCANLEYGKYTSRKKTNTRWMKYIG